MFITNYLKQNYKICLSPKEAMNDYWTAYKSSGRGKMSFKFDICLQIGGALYWCLFDGTLVNGYNNFDKSELKKAIDYIKCKGVTS